MTQIEVTFDEDTLREAKARRQGSRGAPGESHE